MNSLHKIHLEILIVSVYEGVARASQSTCRGGRIALQSVLTLHLVKAGSLLLLLWAVDSRQAAL